MELEDNLLVSSIDSETFYNTGHPLYSTWKGMKSRCCNRNVAGYKTYGAKGINISNDWLSSFKTFVFDMGPKPTAKHTLDRKDNTKGYSKDNCRWATPVEQANNTSRNVKIFVPSVGKILSSLEISEMFNIKQSRITERIKNGTKVDQDLVDNTIFFDYHGKKLTIRDLSIIADISMSTLWSRVQKGMSIEDAVETPVRESYVKYQVNNEELTIPEIGKKFGVNTSSLIRYINLNFTAAQAVNYLTNGIVPKEHINLVNLKQYSLDGNYYTIKGLSKLSGIPTILIASRINNGSSVKDAVFTPNRQDSIHFVNGKEYTKASLARYLNVTFDNVAYYLAKGFTGEETMNIILAKQRKAALTS